MKKIFCLMISSLFILQCSSNRLTHRNAHSGNTSSNVETGNDTIGGDGNTTVTTDGTLGVAQAGKNLVWKRYRPFESGLIKGLGLSKDQLCTELGTNSCIDKVHLTVLGGNEPFINGQYERAQVPTVLTAVAVDRVVLSACSKRIELDGSAGTAATVFKFFPLTPAKPTDDQIKQQATELYRRLLARDPEAAELQAISAFAVGAGGGDRIALSLCFAIGSSAENIFL